MAVTFKGGIHPPEHKELSKDKSIEKLPLPKSVLIPLVQHIGAPCKPLVKVREEVKVGQMIAEMGGFVSSPIFSSISGVIKKISDVEVASGKLVTCVEIESDGLDEWINDPLNRQLEEIEAKEIVEIIREAGIVGMGGAGFPTHVKYTLPNDVKVDTILLNGAECEPYLTCDHRLIVEEGEKVIYGLRAMMKAVNVKKGIIAIENNKPDAIKNMEKLTKDYDDIEVAILKTKYPQGGEKQLIDAVLKREVPSGKLPMHVGVIVNNIHTAYSVAEAVRTGLPSVERVITVSGQGIHTPKNLMVRYGTSVGDIIEYCDGIKENVVKIISGAPMTGYAQYKLDFPIDKRSSGIIALTDNEVDTTPESACIRCSRCLDVCPINLVPSKLDQLGRLNEIEKAIEYDVMDCIECSSCAYICPAHRHLVQSIVSAKNAARALLND